MFGIGGTELLVILVVALIVLGPKAFLRSARTLGKAMGEFRKVSTEFPADTEYGNRARRARKAQAGSGKGTVRHRTESHRGYEAR